MNGRELKCLHCLLFASAEDGWLNSECFVVTNSFSLLNSSEKETGQTTHKATVQVRELFKSP